MQELVIAKLSLEPFGMKEDRHEEVFEPFERVTITHALIDSSSTIITIAEVIWNDKPDVDILKANILRGFGFDDETEVELTEMVLDGNRGVYISRAPRLPLIADIIEMLTDEFYCFFEYPLVIDQDKITIQIVGHRENIKRAVDLFKDLGVVFEIESIREYHIHGRAILSELTDRQYECMKSAVENGYFDIPRKMDLRALASKMDIRHGTLSFHLRKAQRTLFQSLFR